MPAPKEILDLVEIIQESPCKFSVLPAEILGQLYEQFLDSEVKKAGGVYYTPKYIVDYIVKHTVGKLLGDRDSGIVRKRGHSSFCRCVSGAIYVADSYRLCKFRKKMNVPFFSPLKGKR